MRAREEIRLFNAFVYFTGKEKSWHKMSFFKVVLHARAGVSDQPSFKDTIHFIDNWKNLLWITAKINTMFLTSHKMYYTVCPRTLIHFYTESLYIKMDKPSWTHSMYAVCQSNRILWIICEFTMLSYHRKFVKCYRGLCYCMSKKSSPIFM